MIHLRRLEVLLGSALISVVVIVLICGFLWWLLQFLPIAEPFMTIARGLLVFAVILYVLGVLFGFAPPLNFPARVR